MKLPMVDILVSIFFVGALLMTVHFYRRSMSKDKEGLRNLILGLSFLASVSVLELVNSYQLLAKVPLLSEALVYQLLVWIGMITGIVCVALGVSKRFAAQGTSENISASIQRTEVLQHIEQLSQVERRTSVLLQKSLQTFVRGFGCAHGALFIRSRAVGMNFVCSEGTSAIDAENYKHIVFDLQPTALEVLEIASASGLTHPDTIVPVITDAGIAAAFVLWRGKGAAWDTEDLQTMKLAANVVARIVETERLRLKHEFLIDRENWQIDGQRQFNSNQALRDQLPVLLALVRSKMPVDLLSVGILTAPQMMRRISVSEAGGVLDEHRINLFRQPSHVASVLNRNQTLLIHDVSQDRASASDEFLRRNGIQSLVSLQAVQNQSVQVVLTAASKEARQYGRKEASLLEALSPIVREMVQRELSREMLSDYHNRVLVVSDLLRNVAANRSVHEVIEQTGQAISRILNTSIIRISMLDVDGVSLRSRYLSCSHATHVSTPSDGHMILSVLPQHAKLISGEITEPVYCQSEQNEISESEAVLVFAPEVKQMLLMPIRANGSAVGVIGCADMREASRGLFSQQDIVLIQALAGVIGTVIHRMIAADLFYAQTGKSGDVRRESIVNDSVRPAVRSSLSGIVGSLEMLQSSPAAQDEHVQRYLSIIDRSARRMSKVFETASVE
jgi:transcriptional regulator with GAF, ATPase, and Fis domain